MPLSDNWIKHLSATLNSDISHVRKVLGGDINKTYSFVSENQTYFLKCNSNPIASYMLQCEVRGLSMIKQTGTTLVPDPVTLLELDESTALLMPFISSGAESEPFWVNFGSQLASLHKCSYEKFGLDEDNFIGSISQINSWKENWGTFYAENRLIPLVKEAFDLGLLGRKSIKAVDRMCIRLDEIFPKETPCLLHGDLWSGNYLINPENEPVLIDPAVYYGHREMDIAMTKLFGGFRESMYESYHDKYPLIPEWENRMKYYQLYYILVHLLLFGQTYRNQAEEIIMEF